MRITEIASAEEQLALWKLISYNIWTAIGQQTEAERSQRAERAAQKKLKLKIGSKRGGRKSFAPPQQITAPPPIKQPPQAKIEVNKQPTQQMGGGMKYQQANVSNPQQPNALPTQQKAVGVAQQQPNAPNPQATQLQQRHVAQQPLTPQQMRLKRQNAGNLAKISAVTKRL